MSTYKFKLPDIGEGIAEAEIVAWHVKVGDRVEEDQQLADMTISLGSIDPCFSCTDRLETIDLRSGQTRIDSQTELLKLVRAKNETR